MRVLDEVLHERIERIDGLERSHDACFTLKRAQTRHKVVLQSRVDGSAACTWTDDDHSPQSGQVRQHGRCERPLRTEQPIAQGSEHRAMSAPSFLFVIKDQPPFVGIQADPRAFIADTVGVFSRTGRYFHQHLSFVFGVAHTGHELDGFRVALWEGERKGELDQRMFTEPLTGLGTSIARGVFGGDEKPVCITQAAAAHNPLDGEILVVWLIRERGGSASIARFASGTERTACRFQILSRELCMCMFGNIAAACIGFGAIGEALAARHEPIGAIIASVAGALSLPCRANIDREFIDVRRELLIHGCPLPFFLARCRSGSLDLVFALLGMRTEMERTVVEMTLRAPVVKGP